MASTAIAIVSYVYYTEVRLTTTERISAGTKQSNRGNMQQKNVENDMSMIVTMKALGSGFSEGGVTVMVATAGWFVTTTFCIGDITSH